MTESTSLETNVTTVEKISDEIETQREEIKAKLGLDDQAFDILIKDTIIASFAELSIRIKADDPIFAVILSQKKVMNYYTHIIAEALKATPREIGNVIDQKAEDISSLAAKIGEALDEFHTEFLTDLQSKSLEINNSIITSFDKFIDKKIEDFKNALNQAKPTTIQTTNDKQTNIVLLVFLLILGIINTGLVSYIAFIKNNDQSKEIAYQKGLLDGFQKTRKELSAKDADKVEKIIIESIDRKLKEE
ncbi:hypothetical protein [Volucribacter amazonae]|uniref:Uncharacterized protein n=1 Tax=Volucribacter amazonae TaxID=256731 RepID=A0A9X4SMQ7_9PAST|nr:hypothetical protein [Volucribacter amazonae]MDG6896398.1 hypothetical protein [Volucribacter amazonae]